MVLGARAAAACGLQSHGAASALLPNAVAVPRRLAPALVAAKRPERLSGLGSTRRRAGSCAVRQAAPLMNMSHRETCRRRWIALGLAKTTLAGIS